LTCEIRPRTIAPRQTNGREDGSRARSQLRGDQPLRKSRRYQLALQRGGRRRRARHAPRRRPGRDQLEQQFGLSDKPEIDEQFLTYSARAVRNLLDELGIERAHFVGNSLGGGASLKFALEYPERADRLVLMGPGGAFAPVLSPAPSEGLKLLFGFLQPPGPSREKLEAFVRIMVYDQSIVTPELIEERYKAATDPATLRGMQNFMKVAVGATPEQVREGELWRELSRIEHPTLMTWGRDDRVLPLDGAFFALHQMPNARLHVFPRCGHWAQLEHRQEFDRLVIDFLTQPLN
jgi:4,5:9,10-diseco-3-hydroxy-5,9,17-trioxoandrosta-1(10),2-diene-4-oate hydrolase